jgi:hypothetical protein
MAIFLRVSRVPGKTVDITLNNDATVADALAAANIELRDHERVMVCGSELHGRGTSLNAVLADGDRIVAYSVKNYRQGRPINTETPS